MRWRWIVMAAAIAFFVIALVVAVSRSTSTGMLLPAVSIVGFGGWWFWPRQPRT